MHRTLDLPLTVVLTHAPGSMGWGGAVKSGSEMASIIADLFHPTLLVCSDANNEGPAITTGQAQALSRATVRLYPSRRVKKQGFGLAALPVLFDATRRSEGVYVSGVSTWPVTVACLVALVLRKPYIISLHGGLLATHMEEIRTRRPLKRLFYNLITLPTLRAATMVRASSAFEARDAARELPKAEIVTVPNTFDIDTIPFAPPPPAGQGVRLVFVGRLEEDKGIRALLQAWREQAGPDDRFTLVGSGAGAYAEAVRSLAEADDRIRLAGELPRDQVLSALAEAHALVLPSGLEGSLRENFGNVVVEALAVGRPALVTRGLAWDQLPEARIGWTFERSDQGVREALDAVLKGDLLKDPQLAQRCRTYAEENFSSRAVRRAVVAMVRRCMELHGGAKPLRALESATS